MSRRQAVYTACFAPTHKAVDSLDDPNDEAKRKEERKYTRQFNDALKKQLQRSVPTDATDAEILAASQQLAQNGAEMVEAMSDLIAASGMLGIETAEDQFGTIGIAFDLSFVNQQVLENLRTAGIQEMGLINGTSNKRLQSALQAWQNDGRSLQDLSEAIAQWVESGKPLPTLVRSLERSFGGVRNGKSRGLDIAVTEVTRFFNKALNESYKQASQETGLTIEMRFVTANDSLVCPICAPLGGLTFSGDGAVPTSRERQKAKGQTVGLSDKFVHPGGKGAAGTYKGQSFGIPPLHVRCRCDIVPVVVV